MLFKDTSNFWTYAEFFLELIDVYEKFWLFLCNFQPPELKSLTTNETETQKPLYNWYVLDDLRQSWSVCAPWPARIVASPISCARVIHK